MTRTRGRVLLLLCAMAGLTTALDAQRPVPPRRPGQIQAPPPGRPQGAAAQAPGDTARRDTTQRELVKWVEPDSVMAALLQREGYVVTRYQGDRVIFDANLPGITLQGDAAVGRDQTLLVGDTIFYDDSAKMVRALGDTVVLRDPSQGSDVVALGRMAYSLGDRRAIVSNVSTAVESGDKWFVNADNAAVVRGDTATGGGETAFFAYDGALTTCTDSVHAFSDKHYHFRAKEIKVIQRRILVARPAVLYIRDIPVAWLPFVFQDLRSGRRSGILTPRFGVSDIVRNSPTYRRHVENLGYYFALNDYMDAQASMDWRSGARGDEGDPGWTILRGELNYRWLDRFLSGGVRLDRTARRTGDRNLSIGWNHRQEFSRRSSFNANINYATNTRVQRATETNPYLAIATIRSSLNFQQQLGKAQIGIGGNQTQYPGREQRDLSFPTLNVTTGPLNLAPWLVWTPTLGVTNQQSLNIDRSDPLSLRFRQTVPGGPLDTVRLRNRDTRSSSLSFDTPLRIFGFVWSNSFRVRDDESNAPTEQRRVDVNDTTRRFTQVFARTYRTDIDWQTSVSLPQFAQGKWNIVPSVGIVNVDPGAAFWVRTHLSGTEFVNQSKRLQYGIRSAPTFFGLFPGFAGFSRFRQTISPSISYNFAPSKRVSDEFLQAVGQTRQGYNASLRQNVLTLGLSQYIEGKVRGPDTAAAENARKIKIITTNFDGISYNIDKYRDARRRNPGASLATGLMTDRWGYSLRSDLLPGLDLSVRYSLFEGSLQSDTARFKPYRESIDARFSIGKASNPFAPLLRLFGMQPTASAPSDVAADTAPSDAAARRFGPRQGMSGRTGGVQLDMPRGEGWQASFSFTSSRQRPVANAVTIDPAALCARFTNPLQRQLCENDARNQAANADGAAPCLTGGCTVFQAPARTNLQSDVSFGITPKWSANWSTNYDFERGEFGSQVATLRRELHDWDAIFAFTRAPNGAFAFNFFVALKAQPDLKFDYSRQTYRRQR